MGNDTDFRRLDYWRWYGDNTSSGFLNLLFERNPQGEFRAVAAVLEITEVEHFIGMKFPFCITKLLSPNGQYRLERNEFQNLY